MSEQRTRNPIDLAFAAGTVPRHQVHPDQRIARRRRLKHKRPFYEGEE